MSFDPEKADTFVAVTVVKVGEPAMVRVEPCGCGTHRDRYYVYGIENHWVRAADYDALLELYRASQRAVAHGLEAMG
jgi:hypothetical protein